MARYELAITFHTGTPIGHADADPGMAIGVLGIVGSIIPEHGVSAGPEDTFALKRLDEPAAHTHTARLQPDAQWADIARFTAELRDRMDALDDADLIRALRWLALSDEPRHLDMVREALDAS